MKKEYLVKAVLFAVVLLAAIAFVGPMAFAAEEGEAESGDGASGLAALGIGLGAGLAVSVAGLATGLAQSGVGAGGTGAMAERPELFTNILILFAIPETIVLFGFVIAIMLVGKL